MRKIVILIFCLFAAGCAKVETSPKEIVQNDPNKVAAVSPTAEVKQPLKPVTPSVKLNAKQKKYLDKSLPPEVREILEKAEIFEILAESSGQDKSDRERLIFEPTRVVKVAAEKDKKEILEAFYSDASTEDSPASCYEPHHAIRAAYQGQTVEVEICFSCSRFIAKNGSQKFEGTIVRENGKSEDFFNRIVENQGIELKQ
jgi:hypothetical protein